MKNIPSARKYAKEWPALLSPVRFFAFAAAAAAGSSVSALLELAFEDGFALGSVCLPFLRNTTFGAAAASAIFASAFCFLSFFALFFLSVFFFVFLVLLIFLVFFSLCMATACTGLADIRQP